jgi:hypothetical protein
MPLRLPDFPAEPQCGGKQWAVADEDRLATLVALVLVGRAKHVEGILAGTQRTLTPLPAATKEELRQQLQTSPGPVTYHRDGLLFEIISWIAARITANASEIISTPHLKSTQQGLDTVKIGFDDATRNVTRVVIYEQKCTEHPRDRFRDEVIPAFEEWKSHKRDHQLIQAVVNLVERFALTDEEQLRLYERVVQAHPIVFQTALTVTPTPFETARCIALFGGYQEVTPYIADRLGDTFPLADIRAWFATFAYRVWAKIEASDV